MPKAAKFNAKKRITVRNHHVDRKNPSNFMKDAHQISVSVDENVDHLLGGLDFSPEIESNYMTRSYRHAVEHALRKLGIEVEVLKHNKIKVKKSKESIEAQRKRQLEWIEEWNSTEDKYQLLKDTFSKINQ